MKVNVAKQSTRVSLQIFFTSFCIFKFSYRNPMFESCSAIRRNVILDYPRCFSEFDFISYHGSQYLFICIVETEYLHS